jgi:ligand-binding sensor domain-containing protein
MEKGSYGRNRTGSLADLSMANGQALETSEGLPHKVVTALIETSSIDGKKCLLAGTVEGLAKFENGKWVKFDTDWDLRTKRINTLMETVSVDGKYSLWVGTPAGVAKYENGNLDLLR